MRIVGGKYKGRFFKPDKKFKARPTTDLAKEALFNILSNQIEFPGMKVLDLFSGSGRIGYEFLSRGAEEVTFIEKSYPHVRFIKDVIRQLGVENGRVFRTDVFRFLKNGTGTYNIIFADPPFDSKQITGIPTAVMDSGLLQKNGLFILEHSSDYNFSEQTGFRELRKYGKVNFSFFSP